MTSIADKIGKIKLVSWTINKVILPPMMESVGTKSSYKHDYYGVDNVIIMIINCIVTNVVQ